MQCEILTIICKTATTRIDMQEPVTIGERYRSATHSSNLKVNNLQRCDVDYLIAAGWSDSLGIKLYRLAGEYDQVAQDIRRTAADDLTGMVLILMHLNTLSSAKEALWQFALQSATRRGVMLTDREVGAIVSKVLSAWLAPTCQHCNGTGTTGGYDGKVANVCRPCSGSGKTKQAIGKTDIERRFGHWLLSVMESKLAESENMLHKRLRS